MVIVDQSIYDCDTVKYEGQCPECTGTLGWMWHEEMECFQSECCTIEFYLIPQTVKVVIKE